ncbi:hypothetical protein JKF63_00556 [Porcisia hertigi]|uniref:Thioredoxin domain-containing protein n=1 Tax=Porcisia hertigi TaxID=2761500 RepID=A0A836I551_9TRYP|nr:hypothetical protein JKF63_00556 [Porcisia hertigi]
MSGLSKHLLGLTKLQKQDAEVDVNSLSGKIVFIYFSASWCPPCRGFTPQLVNFYQKHHEAKDFEVIFASWDEDEEEYKNYYKKMPWCTIPFAQKNIVEALTKEFKVESIPTLIGLNADTGAVVSTRGRHAVTTDPEGTQFPWSD